MTVINKLSDRDGLVFSLVGLILVNEGPMEPKAIQYKLFQAGVFVNGNLMKQVIATMREKGTLKRPDELVQEKPEAGV